jgi:hypothetical protein
MHEYVQSTVLKSRSKKVVMNVIVEKYRLVSFVKFDNIRRFSKEINLSFRPSIPMNWGTTSWKEFFNDGFIYVFQIGKVNAD